jgi:RNA polymerase sigma-70 factor (ECF subfamily)
MEPNELASEEGAANLRRLVQSFIRARVTDTAIVDDLTQDVLVKAEKAAPSLSESSKVRGWVFRIARNVIADHFRRLNRPISIRYDSTSLGAPDIALLTQEQESRKAHLLRCIRAFVKSLPDHYQMALILVDFEGISQVELAKRIGLSVSAAKSRVQRARTQLRALIEACCQIDTDIYGNFIDCRRTGSWLPCD